LFENFAEKRNEPIKQQAGKQRHVGRKSCNFRGFEWRVSESCGCSPVAAQAAEHSSFVNSRSNIIQQNFQFMCFGNCIKVKIGRCMTNHLAAELKVAANLFFIINC
jgi:hypothetical protein